MQKSQSQFDLKQIAGTLKYGGFDGHKRKWIVLSYVIFTAIFVFMGIGMCVLFITDVIDIGSTTGDTDIWAILGCVFLSVIVPLAMGLLLYKNERQRREIKLWLADAVELTAYSRKIDAFSTLMSKEMYKIQIEFEYNNKSFRYVSRGKEIIGNDKIPDGFHSDWSDYLNKEVRILYSPQYEEVIVLRNKRS